MGISEQSVRSGHTPAFFLWVETPQARLKCFQDRSDFRQHRTLLLDQLVLARKVLRRYSLLSEGVDLVDLGFQSIKALMQRDMGRMHGVVHRVLLLVGMLRHQQQVSSVCSRGATYELTVRVNEN
jgi:hypothetical protein